MKNLEDKKNNNGDNDIKLMIDKDFDLSSEDKKIIRQFCSMCYSMLELTGDYKCYLSIDRKKSKIKTTAICRYGKNNVRIYCQNRSIADILRSIGHEMFHLRQHEMDQVPVKMKVHYLNPIEWTANAAGGSLISYFADSIGKDKIYR